MQIAKGACPFRATLQAHSIMSDAIVRGQRHMQIAKVPVLFRAALQAIHHAETIGRGQTPDG